MHEHLGIGGDRVGHREAGRERRPLETEHIVVPERPATIEAALLHRERPLLGVEPVDPAGPLPLHRRHWPQGAPQMLELHWIPATPVPAADDNSQFDASISRSASISCSDDRSY